MGAVSSAWSTTLFSLWVGPVLTQNVNNISQHVIPAAEDLDHLSAVCNPINQWHQPMTSTNDINQWHQPMISYAIRAYQIVQRQLGRGLLCVCLPLYPCLVTSYQSNMCCMSVWIISQYHTVLWMEMQGSLGTDINTTNILIFPSQSDTMYRWCLNLMKWSNHTIVWHIPVTKY